MLRTTQYQSGYILAFSCISSLSLPKKKKKTTNTQINYYINHKLTLNLRAQTSPNTLRDFFFLLNLPLSKATNNMVLYSTHILVINGAVQV